MQNKSLTAILVIILVIAVAVGLYLAKNNQSISESDLEAEQKKAPAIQTTEVVKSEIPEGFPENLPVELNSRVLQNYETTTNDGRVQSTRTVTTGRTLAQATSVYVNFFSGLGWTEVPGQTSDQNTITTLMMDGTDSLLIIASDNNSDKQKTISLTLTKSVETETIQTNE